MKVKPVILAGGQGARLWPLSHVFKPKQFIKLNRYSLLQETILRNREFGKFLVIVNQAHKSMTQKQIHDLNLDSDIITEPVQKNTTIVALIAALTAQSQGFDTVILLPCDHYISDYPQYNLTINKALAYVKEYGISTIGISASYPSTEYGYIKTSDAIENHVYTTSNFIEKPGLVEAQYYLKEEKYFWNSGIYIFNVNFMLKQAEKFQPNILQQAKNSVLSSTKNQNITSLSEESYMNINSISLDNSIIKYIPKMIMVKSYFKWKDLGNWQALWSVRKKDKANNYCEGNIVVSDTTNSYISSNKNITAVIGLNNIIVVNTDNALLVMNKSKTGEIKSILHSLGAMPK